MLKKITLMAAIAATVAMAPDALAATTVCTPNATIADSNHVAVRCSNATPDGTAQIFYFAVASSSPLADRFLRLATSAVLSGKTLFITFTSGSGANPPGCGVNDCRQSGRIQLP